MSTFPLTTWGTSFANKFDLSHCQDVLEIGCRKGLMSAYLADKYKQTNFLAIDNIHSEIEVASQHPLSNLNFKIDDALSLKFNKEFDAIVSFSCLHWINDKGSALTSMFNALKPNGKAYIQFFAMHGRPKNDRFFDQIAYQDSWYHYFKQYAPDLYEINISAFSALLSRIGFKIHRFEFSRYEDTFDHQDDLSQFLASWSTHKKFIPKAQQELFFQETMKTYLDFNGYNKNKSIPYFEYVLEVICEKPGLDDQKTMYSYSELNFSLKEALVLKHYLLGKSAKEISQLTTTSAKTVEFHIASIKEKLNCRRRSEIYEAAIKYGFINLMYDIQI